MIIKFIYVHNVIQIYFSNIEIHFFELEFANQVQQLEYYIIFGLTIQ